MPPLDTTTALGLILDWLVTTFPTSRQYDGTQEALNLFAASAPLGIVGYGLWMVVGFRVPRLSPAVAILPALSLLATIMILVADAYLGSIGLPRVSWVALLAVPAIACGVLFGLFVGWGATGIVMAFLTAVSVAVATQGEKLTERLTEMREARAAARADK